MKQITINQNPVCFAWRRCIFTFFITFSLISGQALAADQGANLCKNNTVQVNGRDVKGVVPFSALGQTVPLVIGLHPGFSTGALFASSSGLSSEAWSRSFVGVFPNGTALAWNAGNCCGLPLQNNIDDVGFLDMVVWTAITDCAARGITISDVYLLGHSNGAMMAYRYADEGVYKPKGLGIAAGTAGGFKPGVSAYVVGSMRPDSIVVAAHGQLDTNVNFYGGYTTGVDQPRYDYSYNFSFNRISTLMGSGNRDQSTNLWTSSNALGGFAAFIVLPNSGHGYNDLGGTALTATILDTWGL